ncbi:MAG TPA: glycosyltransferase [Longimicrobiales bacterium]
MRIAYVAVGLELDGRLGVAGKIGRQMDAWIRAGHEARFFVQAHRPPELLRSGRLGAAPAEVFTHRRIEGAGAAAGLARRFTILSRMVRRVADWGADVVYIRFNTWYPALESLSRRIPTVLEVNTDDLREYRVMMSRGRFLYHRFGRGRLMRRAAGMVYVTRELAATPSLARFGRPGIVIANGIDLDAYPVLEPAANARPRLVFIGSGGHPWHGVDKILRLAAACPEWRFDLIGFGAEELGGAAPENVTCHGYLSRAEYEPIMARADAAIGTLALHRKQMREASPLKVREYLAYGIPTIIGYRDTDFPGGSEYLLELPNAPDNVETHLGRIRAFVERVRGVRVPRGAIAHLDGRRKERERLAFFEQVVTSAAAGPAARLAGGRT